MARGWNFQVLSSPDPQLSVLPFLVTDMVSFTLWVKVTNTQNSAPQDSVFDRLFGCQLHSQDLFWWRCMVRVLKSCLLEYGRISVLHGITYVFMISFFIFTPGLISDLVAVFCAARAKRPWGWGCWLCVLMKRESIWKFVYQILFIMDLMVQTVWMCETMAILPHGEKDSRLRLSKLCWENSKFWVKKAFWRETAAYSRKCEKEDVNKKSGREGEQVQKMREEPAKSGWLRKFVSLPAGFDELMKVSLQLPHILSVNIEPCSNSAFPFAEVFLTKQW